MLGEKKWKMLPFHEGGQLVKPKMSRPSSGCPALEGPGQEGENVGTERGCRDHQHGEPSIASVLAWAGLTSHMRRDTLPATHRTLTSQTGGGGGCR